MNLPNKLTVLRMGMIPVFLVFMLVPQIPQRFLWAFLFFAAASFTDYLDGHIARKHHLITDFGKFMDPLADKLLVVSALICFVESGWAYSLVVVLILAREFLVTSVRLIAAGHGTVIAADIWGKMKTVSQMVWVMYALLLQWIEEPGSWMEGLLGGSAHVFYIILIVMQCVVLLLTVFSGANYIWKNRELFGDAK